METLPYLTREIAPLGGAFRARPEDFRVEEIPAYEPSGEGEHLYVTFEKRGFTTPDAVRAIARALGVDPREAGWAGLKDKHAITVQTASFARADVDRALALELPGVRVLSARRHRNKLKSGHLHGNRFVIRLRGCDGANAVESIERVRVRLLELGVPNYYGEQRFGRDGDNAARARAWLTGAERPPREPFLRKMYVSALQSEMFNTYVAERLNDGLIATYVDGDLAVRHPVGGAFVIDPAEAVEAYPARRCSPTGPMFGPSMRWPERAARAREERVLSASGVSLEHLARARELGEGTRRSVRMCLETLVARVEPTESTSPRTVGESGDHGAPGNPAAQPPVATVDLVLEFALPAGGYATAVVREFRKLEADDRKQDLASGIESPPPDDAGAV